MNESMLELNAKFEEIKKMGYVKSTRKGPTGIGKTFEDLLGKEEDREPIPDFKGIEIKTKTATSIKPTTLFNSTPVGEGEYEIKRLLETYGYKDKTMPELKAFNIAVYSNYYNCVYGKYVVKLKVDYQEKKVFLEIFDMKMDLIENKVHWKFEELEKRISKKLTYLALVSAKKKRANEVNYYYYYQIDFYKFKNFETFLRLLEQGIICIAFHVGELKSGEKKGEIHDRGTSFRIRECNLTKLFDKIDL